MLKQKDASKEALEGKAEELGKAAQKLGELMYAQSEAAAGGGAQGSAPGGGGGSSADGGKQDEKVVDAEFTEVKSDKK